MYTESKASNQEEAQRRWKLEAKSIAMDPFSPSGTASLSSSASSKKSETTAGTALDDQKASDVATPVVNHENRQDSQSEQATTSATRFLEH